MNTPNAATKKELIALAKHVTSELGRFRTPNTGQPVDPSHVSALVRYLRSRPPAEFVPKYLELLPKSHLARYTGSSGPQLVEACKQAKSALGRVRKIVRDDDEAVVALAYVLGWAARLLRTSERELESSGAPVRPRGQERGRER